MDQAVSDDFFFPFIKSHFASADSVDSSTLGCCNRG